MVIVMFRRLVGRVQQECLDGVHLGELEEMREAFAPVAGFAE